jgi:hypothetical protein
MREVIEVRIGGKQVIEGKSRERGIGGKQGKERGCRKSGTRRG